MNITSQALIHKFCDRIAEMSGYWDKSYNVGRRSIYFPSGSRRGRVARILTESAVTEEIIDRTEKKVKPRTHRMQDGKWIKISMIGTKIVKMENWNGKI